MNIHKLFFATLLVASIFSYVYINTVNIECTTKCAKYSAPSIELEEGQEEQEDTKMIAPDVELVKRLLERGLVLFSRF